MGQRGGGGGTTRIVCGSLNTCLDSIQPASLAPFFSQGVTLDVLFLTNIQVGVVLTVSLLSCAFEFPDNGKKSFVDLSDRIAGLLLVICIIRASASLNWIALFVLHTQHFTDFYISLFPADDIVGLS